VRANSLEDSPKAFSARFKSIMLSAKEKLVPQLDEGIRKVDFRGFALATFFTLSLAGTCVAEQAWEETWDRAVKGAKKEAVVVAYANRGPNWEQIFGDFEKEYPGIKITWVSGTAPANSARMLTERRAGKFLADVYFGSPNTARSMLHPVKALDPIEPALILPEVTEKSKWFQSKHRYSDREGMHLFVYGTNTDPSRFGYNTKLVNQNVFKSYRDFLDPKWKGKMAALDPQIGGGTSVIRLFYYSPKFGPNFIRELYGNMDITYSRNIPQLIDWLANGKYLICIGCRGILQAKDQGLPVDVIDKSGWKEGQALSAGGSAIGLMNRAPHPNSAKVLVNWFLSRKGQTAYQELGDPHEPYNSLRIDISKDVIPMRSRFFEGVDYLDLDTPEMDPVPVVRLINEIRRKR
jgi:iron(III) transport system substrate-binding protein